MELELKRNHIVLLADCLADLTGGAEKQIYELAKRLDKNKYQVTVEVSQLPVFQLPVCRLPVNPS